MKKTLIALMALGGMVNAADGDLTLIYDMDGIRDAVTVSGTITDVSDDWNGASVWDCSKTPVYQGITNSTITDVLSGADTETCITLAFWVNRSSNDYQMLFGWGENGKGVKFGIDHGTICSTTKDVANIQYGTVKEGEWTLIAVTYKSSGTNELDILVRNATAGNNTAVYAFKDKTFNAPTDTTEFSILSANSNSTAEQFNGLLGAVGIFSSTGDVTDVTNTAILAAMGSAPTASIPEPTTATLSLLALAGLAARRRRK